MVNLVTPATEYHSKLGVISEVEYKGTSYKVGMAVCDGLLDDGEPDFRVISVIEDGVTAHCNQISAEYVPHIRSYIVTNIDYSNTVIIDLKKLTNPSPMDILQYGNTPVISQRCTLV